LKLVLGDIAKQDVDMIVTLLPLTLEYRGGINRAILEGAGEKLDEFVLENIYRPKPGDAYAAPGFNLPCKHIVFCIMPYWRTDFDRADRHLVNACRKAMETARQMSLSSIAFPALASGSKGYPPARAARLIIQGILERIDESFQEVRIVCTHEKSLKFFEERLTALKPLS
jgi:O-acetyl-ADP-ribose deacetylase (regulator of RNase III)